MLKIETSFKHSDEELLNQIKGDSEIAFDKLFHKYWQPLFRIAFAILKDSELAKDIIQEVFTNLWVNRQKREIKALFPYLMQATKLKCFETLRRKNIEKDILERFKLIAFTHDTELEISYHEVEKHYESSLERLPEKAQAVFKMSRIENLSNQEIASKLNISIKTVEYHITNALKQLRLSLSDFVVMLLLIFF